MDVKIDEQLISIEESFLQLKELQERKQYLLKEIELWPPITFNSGQDSPQ